MFRPKNTPLKAALANVDGPNLMGATPLWAAIDLPLGLGSILAFSKADPELSKSLAFTTHSYAAEIPRAEAAKSLLDTGAEVVAFSAFTWNVGPALEAAALIKELSPSVRTIFGGPCVPLNDEGLRRFMRENPQVDFAVSGEGEETFLELLKAFLGGGEAALIPGLGCREADGIRTSPPRTGHAELSRFPSAYLSASVVQVPTPKGSIPVVPIETSRGCPLVCSFCDFHRNIHTVRKFPVERVREEVALVEKWGFRGTLYVTDPLANIDLDHFKKVAAICAGTRANLFFNLHAEMFDDEAFAAIGRIPVVSMALGVQSINRSAMRSIDRAFRPDKVTGNIENLLKLKNLSLSLDLIMGLPGDTYEGFKGTLDWALSFDPIPNLSIHHLGIPEDSPIAKRVGAHGITLGDDGIFTTRIDGFEGDDLKRASLLCRVISHMQKTPGGRAQLTDMSRVKGTRPTTVIEKAVGVFQKLGKLSDMPVGAYTY